MYASRHNQLQKMTAAVQTATKALQGGATSISVMPGMQAGAGETFPDAHQAGARGSQDMSAFQQPCGAKSALDGLPAGPGPDLVFHPILETHSVPSPQSGVLASPFGAVTHHVSPPAESQEHSCS